MLNTPAARTPLHTRTLTFRGFARDDGLWDMEGELHDSKAYGYDSSHGRREAGQPIHHLFLRVTLDDSFVIQAITTSMDATPFGECSAADRPMQTMVGQRMGPGWRQAIERHIGGVGGCTHLRELLLNMATAAFQTIPHQMEMRRRASGEPRQDDTQPPFYMGKCMTWDFNGPVVARVAPQFVGWVQPAKRVKPPAPDAAA
jgi:hypothetical protein